jgi:hypothetical protein
MQLDGKCMASYAPCYSVHDDRTSDANCRVLATGCVANCWRARLRATRTQQRRSRTAIEIAVQQGALALEQKAHASLRGWRR